MKKTITLHNFIADLLKSSLIGFCFGMWQQNVFAGLFVAYITFDIFTYLDFK